MKRFVLRENLKLFRKHLLEDMSEREKAYLSHEITLIRRELALLDVTMGGAQTYPMEFGGLAPGDATLLQRSLEKSLLPSLIIDPRAGLHIVDLNDSYQAATLTDRTKVAGQGMFEVFPDNPDLDGADGVANLFESIQIATQTKAPHAMRIQRYDVRDSSGHFITRYWRPENIPILNENGQVAYILHQAEDVTEVILQRVRRALVG